MLRYLNSPVFGKLLLDMASLLVGVFAKISGQPVLPHEWEWAARRHELRRDFHAFGFAALSVGELDRCYQRGVVNLERASEAAVQAARAAINGEDESATELLRTAFQELARENSKLQAAPAVFADTLHAGGLFSDIGYCEFDWPQHAADMLANHLNWAEGRAYFLGCAKRTAISSSNPPMSSEIAYRRSVG